MAKFPFEITDAPEETTPEGAPTPPRPEFKITPAEEEAPPPSRTWTETGEGLRKTAIAKGLESATALGTFSPIGSIETFAAKDVPMMARGVGSYLGEKFDVISPQRAEEIRAPGSQEYLPGYLKDQTELQKKGYIAPITGMPTWKGMAASVQKGPEEGFPALPSEIARQVRQIPDATYKPETAGEKILGEAITGGAQGIPGAVRTMAGRVISGAGAGAGAEMGTQYAGEGEGNEGFATLVGALGGGLLGSKMANAMLPTVVGRDKIAEALAEDLRKGQTPMSLEAARKAIIDGTPITLADIAGPKTLAMLGKYGDLSNASQSRVGQFNAYLRERSLLSGERVGENVRDAMGVTKLDADALQQFNEAAGKVTRDRVYGYLKGRPEADAVDSSLFSRKLIDDVDYQTAVQRALKNSQRLPDEFQIVTPQSIKGVPGAESKILQTPQGLKETPGTPAVPAQEIPGNLAFYQQVDQEIGSMIKIAKRNGDTQLARGLISTQNNLRDELDSVFKRAGSQITYREAQGAARKTFVGEEAPEAGYNFAGSLITSKKNPFTRGEVRREFDAMDPQNQQFTRLGVAARIQDEVESGGIGKVAKKYLDDATFRKDMKHVLGEESFNRIFGTILAENTVRQADQLRFIASKVTPLSAGSLGSTIAIPDILQALVQGQGLQSIAGSAAPTALMGFLGAMGIKQGFSAMERRVADKVIPLALSKDPKDFMEIAKLAEQYPIVNNLFNRLTTTMSVANTNFEQALERAEKKKAGAAAPAGERVGRKSGGRVSAEGKADALVRAAESAKKGINKTTEPLLKSSDDHIAKALEVANRHI